MLRGSKLELDQAYGFGLGFGYNFTNNFALHLDGPGEHGLHRKIANDRQRRESHRHDIGQRDPGTPPRSPST